MHFRYGLRGLRREPIFALTTLLTLALGTAATVTAFSVANAELWRPLSFPHPEQLVAVVSRAADSRQTDGISLDELQSWRAHAKAFTTLTTHAITSRRTAQMGYAESFMTNEVTADYFTTLGLQAMKGRVFSAADANAGVAVLTERGWKRVFDNDPGVIGRSLMLDDHAVTIIGIIASDDSLGSEGELFIPLDELSPQRAGRTFYTMVGRLAPGATLAQAEQQVQAAIDERAVIDPRRRDHRAVATDLSTYYRRTNAQPLYFFLGAALLVLLLTTTNIAGLLVSRAVRRAPEFAIRSAIGGGTRSLAAQLIAEGALIAVPGCAIGLALTYAITQVLGQYVPEEFLYRGTRITIDARVVLATLIAALITTSGLAIVPLGIIRRLGERMAIGSSQRSGETPSAARSRRVLLIGQLAMTVVMLAGAGVFVKSYLAVTQVPLGFEPANAWSIRIAMAGDHFKNPDAVRAYAGEVVERVKHVPGVQHVAPATTSPLLSGYLAMVTPASAAADTQPTRTILRSVGADYFRATGTPIVRGRAINGDDRSGAPEVAVVNEEFVHRVFGGADPIGRRIDLNTQRAPIPGRNGVTIVGVAANVKETGLNEVSFADVYLSFLQAPHTSVEVIVRGHGSDSTMIGALRAAATDQRVPVTNVSSLQSRVDQALQEERFNLIVVAGFAVLALLTAAIGVYGAMAYAVSARWREFGVRVALGASPRALLGGALWQSVRLALIAGAFGLTGALALTRWIGDALYLVPGKHNGMLYNTQVNDPVAFASALVVIVALAVVAGAVPARRASSIDPVKALRAD